MYSNILLSEFSDIHNMRSVSLAHQQVLTGNSDCSNCGPSVFTLSNIPEVLLGFVR